MTEISFRLRRLPGTEWLRGTLLPALLPLCGQPGPAEALKEHPPILTDLGLSDRYAMARLATTLRGIRAELADDLATERRFAAANNTASTVASFGGAGRFRSVFVPGMDDVSRYVATTVETADVGVLLRACTELALALIVIRHDNDQDPNLPPSVAGLAVLQRTYEEAFTVLSTLSTTHAEDSDVVFPNPVSRVRVEPVRYPTSGRVGYQAVHAAADGTTHRCAHRHLEQSTARKCAGRLATRVGVRPVAEGAA